MPVQWPLLIFSVCLGITSGIFVFLGIGELKNMFKKVRFSGALIALICLAVGSCISVFHMGHPERATHLLGNLGSGLSSELLIVVIMGIVSIAYLILAKKHYATATKVLGIIGGLLGIVLSLIAGSSYLLAARPAWNSFTLPLMYLGAGLGMGALLMCGLVFMQKEDDEEKQLALILALIGVIAMVVTALAYVAWIGMAPYQAPSRSLARLLSGDLALMFWAGVVIIGLVVPLVLTIMAAVKSGKAKDALDNTKNLATWMFVSLACSVVGAIVLRVIMYALGTSVESFFQ